MTKDKYTVQGVSLDKIRNKNELRVVRLMPEVLESFIDFHPGIMDIEDIYALTLNNLPPRYVQKGSIVLREEVTDDIIREQIRGAIEVVSGRPKY